MAMSTTMRVFAAVVVVSITGTLVFYSSLNVVPRNARDHGNGVGRNTPLPSSGHRHAGSQAGDAGALPAEAPAPSGWRSWFGGTQADDAGSDSLPVPDPVEERATDDGSDDGDDALTAVDPPGPPAKPATSTSAGGARDSGAGSSPAVGGGGTAVVRGVDGAVDITIPELPAVRHWDVATPKLSAAQLAERDSDLIMHAATAESIGILTTARAVQRASQRCQCAKEPEHPATIAVLCPKGCSGHGKCDRECICANGWGGFGCWTKLSDAEQDGELTLVAAPAAGDCPAALLAGWKQWASEYKLVLVLDKDDVDTMALAGKASAKIKVVTVRKGATLGARLAAGEAAVTSPYMLVLGSDTTISRYTNMKAVVEHLQRTDFLLVGGMVEQWHEPSKRWRIDHRCRQLHVHNYTMSQVWGYQATQRGCMVCSAVSEVVATNVARFRAFGGFDRDLDGEAVFVDLFIRARGMGRGVFGQPLELVGHCLQLQFQRLNECASDPAGDAARDLYKPLGAKFGIVSFSRDHRMQPDVDLCDEGEGAVNTGTDGLATNPCTLKAMETLVLTVGGALQSAGIRYAAAGEVYEGALKYQRLVPWARVLALDAWVTSEQLTALHTQVLPQLLSKSHLASRADAMSDDGHAVQFVIHAKSGLILRLSASLISVGGAAVTLDPYGVEVTPLSEEEYARLPEADHEVGSDNLLRHKSGVTVPLATIEFGSGSLSVRKYAHAYIQELLGGDAWVLNVPGRTSPTALLEASSAGGVGEPVACADCAVGYGSSVCSAGGALTSGCMDDWGWVHDWLNWEPQDDAPIPGAKRAKQKKKRSKKRK